MIKDFLHNWAFPILFVLFIVTVFGFLTVGGIVSLAREKRVRAYCHNVNLPNVQKVYYDLYYCIGVKDGNSIAVSVPDSVLRKE